MNFFKMLVPNKMGAVALVVDVLVLAAIVIIFAKRDAITRWGLVFTLLWFAGLALSMLGGMRDMSEANMTPTGVFNLPLMILGGIAMLSGPVIWIIGSKTNPLPYQVGYYLLSSVVIIKLVLVRIWMLLA